MSNEKEEKGLTKKDFSYLQPKIKFTEGTARMILDKLEQGVKLKDVCKRDGFPSYHDVMKWMSEHEEFGKAVKGLLKNRLYHMSETALEILEEGPKELTREEAAGHKLYFEQMRWFLERLDKEHYSPTHKIEHDNVTRIVFESNIAPKREVTVIEVKEDGTKNKIDVLPEEAPDDDTPQSKEV